jgi:hypothetical protein
MPTVTAFDVIFAEEQDSNVNPLGVNGVGELGVVGTAAPIANAVFHATWVRSRMGPADSTRQGIREDCDVPNEIKPRLQGEPLDCDLLIVEHT